jgi:hypothetical protein
MHKHIQKEVLHNSILNHHLFKHGLISDSIHLKDVWYYDIELKKIVLEDFKTGVE